MHRCGPARYDLPWNPQRIEQRIGRVHRYGQQHGVLVINFLARDNQAQALTFQILSQKLELFGRVLDASDAVLHDATTTPGELAASSLAVGFEASLRKIYEESRSLAEVQGRLELLRDTLTEQRASYDREQTQAATFITSRLDAQVKQVFLRYRDTLSDDLQILGRRLTELLIGYLEATGIPFECHGDDPGIVQVLPSAASRGGARRSFRPPAAGGVDLLHLGHPLLEAAVAEARVTTQGSARVRFTPRGPLPPELAILAGRAGRLRVERAHRGLERADHIVMTAVLDGLPDPLSATAWEALWALDVDDVALVVGVDSMLADRFADAVDDARARDLAAVGERVRALFDRRIEQLERYVEDQIAVLGAERTPSHA